MKFSFELTLVCKHTYATIITLKVDDQDKHLLHSEFTLERCKNEIPKCSKISSVFSKINKEMTDFGVEVVAKDMTKFLEMNNK